MRRPRRNHTAAVALMNLRDAGTVQMNLFSKAKDNTRLMRVMDHINAVRGRGEVLPLTSANSNLVKSVFEKENGLEEAVFGRTDHRILETGGGRRPGQGAVPTAHGFSDASFYTWRAKFGGMSVPDAKRLKELEAENGRLKRLLAESILDDEALKAVFGRKR